MNKVLHELERTVQPLGYHYIGLDGADHHTFLDPDTGAVIKAANSSHVDVTMQRKRLVTAAKRAKHQQASLSSEFVAWLRERFGIGIDQQGEISVVLADAWKEFLDDRHDGVRRGSRQLPYMALKASPEAELVVRGKGGVHGTKTPSVWRLKGPLHGIHSDNDTDEETASDVGNGEVGGSVDVDDDRVARVEPELVESVQTEPAAIGHERGSEPSEPALEPSAPRVESPPLTGRVIPADLAEALQEALGGDLRAENELLREAIMEAADHFAKGTDALKAVWDLHGTPAEPRASRMAPPPAPVMPHQPSERPYKKRRDAGKKPTVAPLGAIRMTDLRALREARDAGTLPDPFGMMQARIVINAFMREHGLPERGRSALSSSLHALDYYGHLRRVERGWFTWGE